MKPGLPAWALTKATPADRLAAQRAHSQDVLAITWGDEKSTRAWARSQGWPAPRSHFEEAFIAKMLESDETFALALSESGIDVSVPKRDQTISSEKLSSLDALYAEGPWDLLVYWLREIRRAVEAGVVVQVEDTTLNSFESFYDWADGRYHKLEDDTRTGWIGDDSRP
jgi:hypothetical protein